MAFADMADKRICANCFGLTIGIYNYGTSSDAPFSVCNNDKFGPTWQPALLEVDDFTLCLPVLGPLAEIGDVSFTVANTKMMHAEGVYTHEKLSDLFAAGYTHEGYWADLYLLALNEASGVIESQGLARLWFTDCHWNEKTVTFEAVARTYWQLGGKYPPETITLTDYPGAPPSSIGHTIPRVFGDYDVEKWPPLGTQADAFYKAMELMGLQKPLATCPTICTDTNEDDSANGPIFHVAQHILKTFPFADSHSVFYYSPELDRLCPMHEADFAITNGAPSYISFAKQHHIWVWMRPHETTAGGANVKYTYDRDEDTHHTLTENGSWCIAKVDRPPDIGILKKIRVYCLYNALLPGNEAIGWMRLHDTDNGMWVGGYTVLGTNDVGTDPIADYHSINCATYNWNTVNDLPGNMGVGLYKTGDVGNTDPIEIVELAVAFKIQLPYMLAPGASPAKPVTPSRTWGMKHRPPLGLPTVDDDTFPAIAEKGDRVFVACQGRGDDGFGTITGTPAALIERPADILHVILGSCDTSENTTNDPGDIDKAAADQSADSVTGGGHIGKRESFRDIAEDICKQTGMGLTVRTGTAMKVGLVYWGSEAADNLYGTTIHYDDVLADSETKIGKTSLADVYNAIYIHGDYDPRTGKARKLAMCDGSTSDDGDGNDDYGSKAALATSETNYDRQDFSLRAKYLTGDLTGIRDLCAAWMVEPHVAIHNLALPWKYYDLQVGHVAELDNDSWVAAGMKYPGSTGGTPGAWSAGGTTRYFWVTRLTFSDLGYIVVDLVEGVW